MRVRLLLAALCIGLCMPAQSSAQAAATPANPGADLRVSLLTFAPGETYWERFGHNAILVENTITGANAVYNYGMFDFAQKNFFLNFARGYMVYRLSVDSLDRTLYAYAAEGRWVYQQVLDLDAGQRLQLALFLDRNAQPDQREYRYDYFRDNCSTRVRDALDGVLDGAMARTLKAQPISATYRFEGTRLIRPILPLALGMDAIMGPAGDVPMTRWEQSFVPGVFQQTVAEQRINGKPLVGEARFLLADARSPVAPAEPVRWNDAALGLGLAMGLLLAWAGHRRARLPFGMLATPVLLVAGLGGVFMLAAWALTEHWAMAANWNLLLFSPLAFLLLPTAWRQPHVPDSKPHRRRMALLVWAVVIGAGLSVLGGQQNTVWILLWLPIHFGLAYGLLRRL